MNKQTKKKGPPTLIWRHLSPQKPPLEFNRFPINPQTPRMRAHRLMPPPPFHTFLPLLPFVTDLSRCISLSMNFSSMHSSVNEFFLDAFLCHRIFPRCIPLSQNFSSVHFFVNEFSRCISLSVNFLSVIYFASELLCEGMIWASIRCFFLFLIILKFSLCFFVLITWLPFCCIFILFNSLSHISIKI